MLKNSYYSYFEYIRRSLKLLLVCVGIACYLSDEHVVQARFGLVEDPHTSGQIVNMLLKKAMKYDL